MHKYFNPWKNEKCLQWAIDNDEDFCIGQKSFEMVNFLDHYSYNLGDYLTFHNGGENKAIEWALKNYDDLEFEFEHNPSWYYNNHSGEWCSFSPSYLQEKAGCKMNFSEGIEITTIPFNHEIELQAENNKSAYIIVDGYFKVFARVA